MITPKAKYATYSNWRGGTLEPLPASEQAELYNYSTRSGPFEIENVAGHSHREAGLRSTLERAIRDELQKYLALDQAGAQRHGLDEYHLVAALEQTVSKIERLRTLKKLADQATHHLPPRHQPPNWVRVDHLSPRAACLALRPAAEARLSGPSRHRDSPCRPDGPSLRG